MSTTAITRRSFIGCSVAAAAGAVLLKTADVLGQAASAPAGVTEVTVTEDLMREHGVLTRLSLIYGFVASKLQPSAAAPPELSKALDIEDRFIHNYHEKQEEEFIFPVFEQAKQQVDLVKTLRAQHDAGRKLNKELRHLATQKDGHKRLRELIAMMDRQYSPHKAREETVLFVQFKTLVTPQQYDKIGDRMEDREKDLFGQDGFQKIVQQVAEIEKSLGIFDLAQFTANP